MCFSIYLPKLLEIVAKQPPIHQPFTKQETTRCLLSRLLHIDQLLFDGRRWITT